MQLKQTFNFPTPPCLLSHQNIRKMFSFFICNSIHFLYFSLYLTHYCCNLCFLWSCPGFNIDMIIWPTGWLWFDSIHQWDANWVILPWSQCRLTDINFKMHNYSPDRVYCTMGYNLSKAIQHGWFAQHQWNGNFEKGVILGLIAGCHNRACIQQGRLFFFCAEVLISGPLDENIWTAKSRWHSGQGGVFFWRYATPP